MVYLFIYLFQFPSNGKLHPNLGNEESIEIKNSGFQFPSNGKLHPNKLDGQGGRLYQVNVSIPFKRETPSKLSIINGGNGGFRPMFQFPSNGKLHPNIFPAETEFKWQPSFNSLQTGNSIQTTKRTPLKRQITDCFNSLQTGNSIQTRFPLVFIWDISWWFQFPSNGKLHPNLLSKEYR